MKPPPSSRSLREDNPAGNRDDDARLLELVAEKLVRFGQQVGVTPGQMISLLDSGVSIRELLAFLASKGSGAA